LSTRTQADCVGGIDCGLTTSLFCLSNSSSLLWRLSICGFVKPQIRPVGSSTHSSFSWLEAGTTSAGKIDQTANRAVAKQRILIIVPRSVSSVADKCSARETGNNLLADVKTTAGCNNDRWLFRKQSVRRHFFPSCGRHSAQPWRNCRVTRLSWRPPSARTFGRFGCGCLHLHHGAYRGL
jgi:hypothetical protein